MGPFWFALMRAMVLEPSRGQNHPDCAPDFPGVRRVCFPVVVVGGLHFFVPDNHLFLAQGTPFRPFFFLGRDFLIYHRGNLAFSLAVDHVVKGAISAFADDENHVVSSCVAALYANEFNVLCLGMCQLVIYPNSPGVLQKGRRRARMNGTRTGTRQVKTIPLITEVMA